MYQVQMKNTYGYVTEPEYCTLDSVGVGENKHYLLFALSFRLPLAGSQKVFYCTVMEPLE